MSYSYLNTVNRGVPISCYITNYSLNFSSGHIFTFPSKRVSCPVFEIEVAVFVLHQYITCDIWYFCL